MDQPQWLAEAWREFGQREIAGSAENPRIVALYRDAGHGEIQDDETAWCAAFTGACLKRAGVMPSGSLMARSYLTWGTPSRRAQTGSIAVLSRGGDPASGHVGFVIGETADSVILLGGNQSDAVSVAAFAKDRLLGLRWPMPNEEQPGDSSGVAHDRAIFTRALAHVLAMEGSFTDDPYDPGGPTNKGITLRVYAEWKHVTVDATSFAELKDELRRIPDDVVREIYAARYWTPASCESLPPALALFHFDAGVNHGVGTANRMLQEALGVMIDGDIGPETLGAIASTEITAVLERYATMRRNRYRALPHFWRFGRGWLARVDATLNAARAELSVTVPQTKKGPHPMTPTTQSTSTGTTAALKPKWWGESITIWGACITALASVLPAIASLSGISLSPDIILDAGNQMAAAAQALVALVGTAVAIYGRFKATQPLERRAISLRL